MGLPNFFTEKKNISKNLHFLEISCFCPDIASLDCLKNKKKNDICKHFPNFLHNFFCLVKSEDFPLYIQSFYYISTIISCQGCLQNCLGDSVREKEKTEMRTALPFSRQPLLGSTLSHSL